MKSHAAITAALAAAFLVLLVPEMAAAQSGQNPQQGQNSSSSGTYAAHEATQMVPAQAVLKTSIDARNATPGQPIEARLSDTVHLKNGQKLHSGTVLEGKVAKDDMQENGTSKLALCFDQARLKDGKTIPIKATIVGVFGPGAGTEENQGYPIQAGDQVSNNWTRSVHAVDQIDALSGIDLHSRISSQNSGVLVSTKKDDIKLKPGTELALAIAPQGPGQQSANKMTGR